MDMRDSAQKESSLNERHSKLRRILSSNIHPSSPGHDRSIPSRMKSGFSAQYFHHLSAVGGPLDGAALTTRNGGSTFACDFVVWHDGQRYRCESDQRLLLPFGKNGGPAALVGRNRIIGFYRQAHPRQWRRTCRPQQPEKGKAWRTPVPFVLLSDSPSGYSKKNLAVNNVTSKLLRNPPHI
jgi:hypothetical protein